MEPVNQTASKQMLDLLKDVPKPTPPPAAEKVAETVVVDAPPPVAEVPVKKEEPAKKEETPVAETTPAPTPTEEAKPAEKPWYETTPEDKAKPAEADTFDYKKEYETVFSDPLLKAIAEGVKAGKNPLEVIQELQPTDYRKMDLETLAAAYGKSENWSDDDISDEISKLEGKTRTEIKQIQDTWLRELEAKQNGKMEGFTNSQAEQIRKQRETEQLVQKTFETELKARCEQMLGNEINGVKLTKDHVNDYIKFASEFTMVREDNTIKEQVMFTSYLGSNLSQFMNAAKSTGESKGREEVLNDVHRPNPISSSPQRLPEVKKEPTQDEKAAELLKIRTGRV